MLANGIHYRTIWEDPENQEFINIIDQRYLPHKFVIVKLTSVEEIAKQ